MIDQYLCILVGIAGGVLFSQLPGFTVQYMQNLNGRLDELEPIVEEFRMDVAVYNYTLESALEECEYAHGLLDALCETFEDILLRYQELRQHQEDLHEISPYIRPIQLLRTVHGDIASSVWEEFEPVVPTSDHGLVYLGVGFLTAFVLLQAIVCFGHRICCRQARRKHTSNDDDDLPQHTAQIL